ncbi:hypothetical protein EON81_23300 [bacterium]|nr:MAG: hypothetical protein EON81_23300 [bacterium]
MIILALTQLQSSADLVAELPTPYIAFVRSNAPKLSPVIGKVVREAGATPQVLPDGSVIVLREGMRYYFSENLGPLQRLRLQMEYLGPLLSATEDGGAVRLGELGPAATEFIRDAVSRAMPLYDPASITAETHVMITSHCEAELAKDGKTFSATRTGNPARAFSEEERKESDQRFRSVPMRYKPMPKGYDAAVQEAMKADEKAPPPGYTVRYSNVVSSSNIESARFLRVGGEIWEEIVRDQTQKVETKWAPQLASWKARYPELNPRLGEPWPSGRASQSGEPTGNAYVVRARRSVMVRLWSENGGIGLDLYP